MLIEQVSLTHTFGPMHATVIILEHVSVVFRLVMKYKSLTQLIHDALLHAFWTIRYCCGSTSVFSG